MAVFIQFLVIFVSLSAYLYSISFGSDSMFQLEKSELDRLSKGEVVVKTEQSDNNKKRVQAAILIESSARQVWNVVTDCDHAPKFIPHLKSCKVLQQDGNTEIIKQQVKLTWFLPRITYVFRSDYQRFKRIEFKKISGDLRDLEGSWVLEETDDGHQTILVYSVFLDPGFFVPKWLVRRALRRDLPDFLLALRKRVSESAL